VSGWWRRLMLWDGALPLAVWGMPRAVLWLFPGDRWPIEVLGVGLPIFAFLWRFLAGFAVVRTLPNGPLVRAARIMLLFFGIFLLLVIDTAMILRLVMPPGAFLERGDLIAFAVLYGVYVLAMALATWPGPRASSETTASEK